MAENIENNTHLQKGCSILLSIYTKNFDYPEKPLKYKHIRRISD